MLILPFAKQFLQFFPDPLRHEPQPPDRPYGCAGLRHRHGGLQHDARAGLPGGHPPRCRVRRRLRHRRHRLLSGVRRRARHQRIPGGDGRIQGHDAGDRGRLLHLLPLPRAAEGPARQDRAGEAGVIGEKNMHVLRYHIPANEK